MCRMIFQQVMISQGAEALKTMTARLAMEVQKAMTARLAMEVRKTMPVGQAMPASQA